VSLVLARNNYFASIRYVDLPEGLSAQSVLKYSWILN